MKLKLVRICCHCHRVADARGAWKTYSTHPACRWKLATHGICNDCLKQFYPNLAHSIIAKISAGSVPRCAAADSRR